MELHRIAAVLLGGAAAPEQPGERADGAGRGNRPGYRGNGTGYVLGRRLVLTAGHVVEGQDSCEVQLPGGPSSRCAVVWRGGGPADAALLLAERDLTDRAASVRWGRVVTSRPHPCRVAGYPVVGQRTGSRLDLEQPLGTLAPGTSSLSHRYAVELTNAPPQVSAPSPWSGQSGAALFCGGSDWSRPLLTGVVATDVSGWQLPRWEAVPAYVLLADGDFTALVRRHTGERPVLEPVELQDVIAPHAPWRIRSPATLLDHRAEAIRFHGRSALMRELAEDWCAGGGVRLAVLTGPGGAGKSRLAGELAAVLPERYGWVSGRLDDRGPEQDYEVLAEVDRPLLLVADYAEQRLGQLVALLTVLERRPEDRPPVRLLLTARGLGEGTGGWWDQLRVRTRETRALTYDVLHRELGPLTGLDDRDTHYRHALDDLAARLPEALPPRLRSLDIDWPARTGAVAGRDLSAERYGSALTLHMTALADLLATDPATRPHSSSLDVEEQLLLHERAYWEDTAATRPALAPVRPVALADATGMAVLTAGAEEPRARSLLRATHGFRTAGDALVAAGTDWLGALYPATRDTCWSGLQPDRLGAYHLGERTLRTPSLVTLPLVVLAKAAGRARRAGEPAGDALTGALITASRAGAHPRHKEAVTASLTKAMGHGTELLASSVLSAATLTDEPAVLVDVLLGLTEAPDTDPMTLVDLLDELDGSGSVGLARWAERSAGVAVDRMGARGPRRGHVLALLHRAAWAEALGEVGTALECCERAMTALSRTGLDPGDRAEVLVRAWTRKASSLCRTGESEEARDALDRAEREAGELAPDAPKTLLGELLGVRGRLHRLTGEPREALAAQDERIALLAELDQAEVPGAASGLAEALSERAILLGELGGRRAALENTERSVAYYLEIARTRPDAVDDTVLAGLTSRLNRLRQLGRTEEALDLAGRIVTLTETLCAARPRSAGLSLAVSVNNLGGVLVELGRADEALAHLERGTAIRRELLSEGIGTREALASSLLNLSAALSDLGRSDAAREAGQECVEVCAALADEGLAPAVLQARALNNMASVVLGARQEGVAGPGGESTYRLDPTEADLRRALGFADRAATLYEENLELLPGDRLAEYAGALLNAALIETRLGQHAAALVRRSELLRVRRFMARGDPELHLGPLATDLLETAAHREAYGRHARSVEALRVEAVEALRALDERRGPGHHGLELAGALAKLGVGHARNRRYEDALARLGEAQDVLERVRPYADPTAWAFLAARLHHNTADTLPWTGRFDEALAASRAAEALFRVLEAEFPGEYAHEAEESVEQQEHIRHAASHGLPEPPPKPRRKGWWRRG